MEQATLPLESKKPKAAYIATPPRKTLDIGETATLWLKELERRAQAFTKPADPLPPDALSKELDSQLKVVQLITQLHTLSGG